MFPKAALRFGERALDELLRLRADARRPEMALQTCDDRQRLGPRRPGNSQRAGNASGFDLDTEAELPKWLRVDPQLSARRSRCLTLCTHRASENGVADILRVVLLNSDGALLVFSGHSDVLC